MNLLSKKRSAFTLVEILLVIVIIAILAGIVIVAINPARQVSQANDAQRDSDVRAIIDAVAQYSIENRGALPSAITTTSTVVGSSTGQIDICSDLVPTFLAEMPFDPTATGASYTDCTDYNTGYNISSDATSGRVTVTAPSAENGAISITR